jgi:pre-60S factor REI1
VTKEGASSHSHPVMAAVATAPATAPAGQSEFNYTCISCSLAFITASLQRQHYTSDLHRYNAKRRVAGLPPVSAAVFNEKVLERRAQANPTSTSASKLACKTCG